MPLALLMVRNTQPKSTKRLGGDFLVSCTPLFDEEGASIGSVHVARDITGRNGPKRPCGESEEKFRSIFENTLIGIFQATFEGRFITANPALARIFGYESPDDLISSITDIGQQIYADSVDRERWSPFSSRPAVWRDSYQGPKKRRQ